MRERAMSHDESLIQGWRAVITSRNAAGQNADSKKMADEPLPNAYIKPSQGNVKQNQHLEANVMSDCTDLLDKLAGGLNEEQRHAFFLVCDHRRHNHANNPKPPSQLLLYLSGAGGTGKSKV